jgi:guanylate cyclase soluble subunit beta
MYGLINKALKDMVTDRFGNEVWQQILDESGVPQDAFLTMRSYDDEITYSLVAASSKVLNAPAEACLEMFGQYWVLVTATESYGMLMDAAGENLIEFLENLNQLHDRITTTFLNYLPPTFHLEPVSDNLYEIHYISQRQGLDAFVVGLLQGLATRFETKLELLSQRSEPADTGTHIVFKVAIENQ